jgi:hypothetical protein
MNKLTDIALKDIVSLLESNKNPWPTNYTKVKKIQFLQNVKNYYEEAENFEVCTKIQGFIKEIENAPLGKSKTVK